MSNTIGTEEVLDLNENQQLYKIYLVIRLLLLTAILGAIIGFQLSEKEYVNFDVFFPGLVALSVSFFFHFIFAAFFDFSIQRPINALILFFVDNLLVAYMHVLGLNSSFLVFMFLFNLATSSFIFKKNGAAGLAMATSMLFSVLAVAKSTFIDNSLYLIIGFNNLSFFVTAYLASILSEQFKLMGTQLKERGKDIHLLKNLNEIILRSMNSGLLTVDKDKKLVQVNKAATEILSLSEEYFKGKTAGQFFPFLDENPMFFSDNKVVGFEGEIQGPNQEMMILRFNCAPLRGENEELIGHILSFDDVSRVKKLERTLRQNEKMAAIGQLAAGIAHEIRNPLASISGSVQLLADVKNLSEQDKKLFSIITKEISRLDLLITEFLDYAKPQAPLDQEVDLSFLMREIFEMIKFNDKLPHHIIQKLNIQENIYVKGNRDKLKQAILNIVINAYQAMQRREDAVFMASLSLQDGKARLDLTDNGEGIEPKVLRKIFEPFMTTKEKGTGLGLAITHSIFDHHKASVEVTSSLGKGTTFRIEFSQAKKLSA